MAVPGSRQNLVMVAALIVLPLRRGRRALALGLASLAASILDISALEWLPAIPFSIGYWVWITSFATLAVRLPGWLARVA